MSFFELGEPDHCYCSHPAGAHSNSICPLKAACGEAQMPRGHHLIGSDAVQRGARHGLNSNSKGSDPSAKRTLPFAEGSDPFALIQPAPETIPSLPGIFS